MQLFSRWQGVKSCLFKGPTVFDLEWSENYLRLKFMFGLIVTASLKMLQFCISIYDGKQFNSALCCQNQNIKWSLVSSTTSNMFITKALN